MCKYEMDLVSNVEDTDSTLFCQRPGRRTDEQGETSIPSSTSLSGGYNKYNYDLILHIWSIANVTWLFYHVVSKAHFVHNTSWKEHEGPELIDKLHIDIFIYLTNEFPSLKSQ